MALMRDFKKTVRARAQNDPSFRLALIEEAIGSLLDGDLDSGSSILSNFINATIGYQILAERTGLSAKSLMRMLGPAGNPTAINHFKIIGEVKNERTSHLIFACAAPKATRKTQARRSVFRVYGSLDGVRKG